MCYKKKARRSVKKEDNITVLGERTVRVQNRIAKWRDNEHEELVKDTHRVLTV